jgi:hypothetical protein
MDLPASWKLADEFFIPGKDLQPNVRERYAQISQALHALGTMKERFILAPLVGTDDDFVVMKTCWQAESFCERYHTINIFMKELGEEIKRMSKDFFAMFDASCTELTELFATLLAYISRTVHLQDSFCLLVKTCRHDVAISEGHAIQLKNQLKGCKDELNSQAQQHAEAVKSFQSEIQSLKHEAERIEAEKNLPWSVVYPGASDPNSYETSKEWYEAELSYFRDLSSQRELRNQAVVLNFEKFQASAEKVEEDCRRHVMRIKELELQVDEFVSKSQNKALLVTSSSQTSEDDTVFVSIVKPAVISRGGANHDVPIPFVLSRSMELETLNDSQKSAKIILSLPPCFHLVHEDEQHQARLDAKKERARAGARSRHSITVAKQNLNSWKDVMRQALSAPGEYVVMNLRKSSASIGEIWAGYLSQIDNSGSRNLGMSTDCSCSPEVCRPGAEVLSPSPAPNSNLLRPRWANSSTHCTKIRCAPLCSKKWCATHAERRNPPRSWAVRVRPYCRGAPRGPRRQPRAAP